jgi:PAS domain S-box-containing protein
MVRVSIGDTSYMFGDGDVLGSNGTIAPEAFRDIPGIQSRHVLFIEQDNESFFLIPRNVIGESKLDGATIEQGVRQRIFDKHKLSLNEAQLLIQRISDHDVETGKSSSRKLGKDLGLLELIVDNIDDLIAVVDSKGNRVWNNSAYARVLGYTVEKLAGSQSLIEVHPDDLLIVQEAFRESISIGTSRRIEYRLRHSDGHYVYLESQGWVLPESGDRERLLVVISRDISLRKVLEHQQIAQMTDAANYVRSQLPVNLTDQVRTDWLYLPSTTLGGDALDFFWIDQHYLVFYLLDVVGHGVGSALLAISILQLLRQRGLKGAELKDPKSVLGALNRSFQMDEQGEKVFSIWYGVYDCQSRELRYAAAGHPPAILLRANPESNSEWLKARGLVIGASEVPTYEEASVTVPPEATLFIYSDGLFELSNSAGGMLGMDGFRDLLSGLYATRELNLENLLRSIQRIHGSDEFEDDASILQLKF